MHMIYIWIDRKFCFKFNGVHLKVGRGHLRGQKGSFWGHKSETRPNTHNMHMIRFLSNELPIKRFQIFWRFIIYAYHDHLGSKIDPKKVEKAKISYLIWVITDWSWHAYLSFPNFLKIYNLFIKCQFHDQLRSKILQKGQKLFIWYE